MAIIGNNGKGTKKKTDAVASDTQNSVSLATMANRGRGYTISATDGPSPGMPNRGRRVPRTLISDSESDGPQTSQEFYGTGGYDRGIGRNYTISANESERAVAQYDPLGESVKAADLAGRPRPTDLPPGLNRSFLESGSKGGHMALNPTPSKTTRTRRRTSRPVVVDRQDKLG